MFITHFTWFVFGRVESYCSELEAISLLARLSFQVARICQVIGNFQWQTPRVRNVPDSRVAACQVGFLHSGIPIDSGRGRASTHPRHMLYLKIGDMIPPGVASSCQTSDAHPDLDSPSGIYIKDRDHPSHIKHHVVKRQISEPTSDGKNLCPSKCKLYKSLARCHSKS